MNRRPARSRALAVVATAVAAMSVATPLSDSWATPATVDLTSVVPQESFACSVASAGDVDGDGYADLIVGAYQSGPAGAAPGRAYVYFGGLRLSDRPDLVLTGEAAGDAFGVCVASAGDVNKDGYADLIVGAYQNSAHGANAGRAYIFFGGKHPDSQPDVVLTGQAAGDAFGYSVASAGDVNGDGYADVIVGAYENSASGPGAGRAYLYLGGPRPHSVPDAVFSGEAPGDRFGIAVAGAGDMNKDGFADVIIGAYGNDAGGVDAGRAYVFYGGTHPHLRPDLTLTGASRGDFFGYAVAGAGDVNKDGYSDVIVGAYHNNAGGKDAGRAYVYFGGRQPSDRADLVLTGDAAGDAFGYSVASAGDVNGDGYGDLIVGAYGNDVGGSAAGRAYVYFGGALPDPSPDFTATGSATLDNLGFSVAGAGDTNGDGFADIIVGAPYGDNGSGRALVSTAVGRNRPIAER